MDSTANFGSSRVYPGVRWLTPPDPHIYTYRVVTSGHIGVINSGRKKYTSKIGNSSRIPNLASKIGALCHIFRDIDVFSAFTEVALLGETLVKALKMSIFSKISP